MLIDVIEVKPLPGCRLWIKFEDGVSGEADLKNLIPFQGVFASLKNEKEFAKVSVHSELGVVCWPNGADLDSDVLYSLVTGKPITFDEVISVSSDPSVHV